MSKLATVTKCIQNLKNTLKTLNTTDLSRRRALAQQIRRDMYRHACVTTTVSGQGIGGNRRCDGAVRDNPPSEGRANIRI
jgi:hypothetical protein